jgi:alpha-D-xyloside xylohydrolase
MLEKMVRLRRDVIKPYIQQLDRNVSSRGVPTMRPLAYEFPADPKCSGINDQYMLGPKFLVAVRQVLPTFALPPSCIICACNA